MRRWPTSSPQARLALGDKLGPVLWQLPPTLGFDAERLADFFGKLPRTTRAAAELGGRHDERVAGRAYLDVTSDHEIRHAVEVRHDSFLAPEFLDLLRQHDIGLVVADTAGKWPLIREVTADFAYVRLHGDTELYASGYSDAALDEWATLMRGWAEGGRDVYAYFDNDMKVRAPFDAMGLIERLADLGPTRRPVLGPDHLEVGRRTPGQAARAEAARPCSRPSGRRLRDTLPRAGVPPSSVATLTLLVGLLSPVGVLCIVTSPTPRRPTVAGALAVERSSRVPGTAVSFGCGRWLEQRVDGASPTCA